MRALTARKISVVGCVNAYLLFISAKTLESYYAVYKSVKRIVAAYTHVVARVEFSASLTNENVTGKNCLTVRTLRSESFSGAVPSVSRAAHSFFMSE